MGSSLLYIETTDITNDVQLTYQEHKLQELISKQVDLEYGVGDIITIITLLVAALGAMMISLIANRISSFSNKFGIDYISLLVAAVILIACLGYASYAQCKTSKDRSTLQCQITQTLNAIQLYKQSKTQGNTQ